MSDIFNYTFDFKTGYICPWRLLHFPLCVACVRYFTRFASALLPWLVLSSLGRVCIPGLITLTYPRSLTLMLSVVSSSSSLGGSTLFSFLILRVWPSLSLCFCLQTGALGLSWSLVLCFWPELVHQAVSASEELWFLQGIRLQQFSSFPQRKTHIHIN